MAVDLARDGRFDITALAPSISARATSSRRQSLTAFDPYPKMATLMKLPTTIRCCVCTCTATRVRVEEVCR